MRVGLQRPDRDISIFLRLQQSTLHLWPEPQWDGSIFFTDNGKTWVAIDLGKSYTVISAFVAQDSFVFAGATNSSLDGGIFRSISTSNIWIAADSGLTTRYITSLAVNGNNIYAGTDRGVFLSANNGGVWKALNSGLPSKTVYFFKRLSQTAILLSPAPISWAPSGRSTMAYTGPRSIPDLRTTLARRSSPLQNQ